MSQNDYIIANQSAPDFRSDLNEALQALASLSSGSTAPSTTYANMLWYDTANNILKMRTEADDAWINIGTLDQSTNEFEVAGLTTLSEATWETGTSTTEGLVSPAKVKAAIEANAESPVKAWVNFNGTGTVSIRESFNVSSITDNGTGDYTVNFDTALTDSNYSCVADGSTAGNTDGRHANPRSFSTTSVRITTKTGGGGGTTDLDTVTAAIFR